MASPLDILPAAQRIVAASARHEIRLDVDRQCMGVDGRDVCLRSQQPLETAELYDVFGRVAEIADLLSFASERALGEIQVGTPDEIVAVAAERDARCAEGVSRLFPSERAAGLFCPHDQTIYARRNDSLGLTVKHEIGHAIEEGDPAIEELFSQILFWRYALLAFHEAGIPPGEDRDFLMSLVLEPSLADDMSCEDKRWYRNLWNEYDLGRYFPTSHSTSNQAELFAAIVERYAPEGDGAEGTPPFYAGLVRALGGLYLMGADGFAVLAVRAYPDLVAIKPDQIGDLQTRASARESRDLQDPFTLAAIWFAKGLALVAIPRILQHAASFAELHRGAGGSVFRTMRSRLRAEFRAGFCLNPVPEMGEILSARTRWLARLAGLAAVGGLTAAFWNEERQALDVECAMPLTWTNGEASQFYLTNGLAIAGGLGWGVIGGLAGNWILSRALRGSMARGVGGMMDEAMAEAFLDVVEEAQAGQLSCEVVRTRVASRVLAARLAPAPKAKAKPARIAQRPLRYDAIDEGDAGWMGRPVFVPTVGAGSFIGVPSGLFVGGFAPAPVPVLVW